MAADESARNQAIVAFRAPPELLAEIVAQAKSEGITKSDVARRALIRDLRKAEAAA